MEGVPEKDDDASSRMYSFWLPDIFIKKSLNIPKSRKSKKDRQHNGQQQKRRKDKNGQQNTKQKTDDSAKHTTKNRW